MAFSKRCGHVHRRAAHEIPLQWAQCLPHELPRALLAAPASDLQYPAPLDVGHDAREVIRLLAVPEALLVHADERYLVGVAPGHPAPDGRGHDLLNLAPAQAENPLGVLYALRRLQHVNRERLEKQREAGALRRPRKFYGLDPVLRTRRARRPGVYLRDELHRVQMPPAPLLEPVVDARQLAALGAYRRPLRILHVHVDALPGHVEGHVRHCPFIAKPQKSRVVLINVHP